jgi:hypothetical protein
MDNITCQLSGSTYALNADNSVSDSTGANAGTWKRLQASPATNGVVVSLPAGDVDVPANYQFNSNNQLLVSLQNSDKTWTNPQLLNGRLIVPDNQNIGYQFVDSQGNDLSGALTVYGGLRLDANNDVTITLAEGGLTVINADQITHDSNSTTGTGTDVIIVAATTYDYDGSLMLPASITLPGSFKPAGNSLVFELNGQTGINLTFTGTFKGTSLGFEYHQGNGTETLVFTASGSYRWNSGDATFTVYLGNSAQGFSANLAAAVTTTLGSGRLSLEGKLDFGPSGGSGLNMDLSLAVQQKWDANNCIAFDVVASDQGGLISYDLGIEGTAKLAGGKLTFDLKYSSTGTTSIDLGYTGPDLSAAVDITFNQDLTKVGVGVTLSVQFSWQNGMRVASPVQQTAAATP